MKRMLAGLLLTCGVLSAQQEVRLSQKPEDNSYTVILHYTGTNLDYTCTAQSLQPATQIAVTTVSNANPGSVTATAHGFYYSASGVTAKGVVFISGATGMWTPINGTHIVTPTSANALNLDVDTSTFGSFSGQAVVMTTKAPLTTKNVWSVQSLVPDASGNTVFLAWRASAATTTLGDLGSGSTRPTTCVAPTAFQ